MVLRTSSQVHLRQETKDSNVAVRKKTREKSDTRGSEKNAQVVKDGSEGVLSYYPIYA